MLKEQAKVISRLTKIVDLTLVVAAFTTAYQVRHHAVPLQNFTDYLWILLVVLPLWHLLLTRYGLYGSLRTISLTRIVSSLFLVHLLGGMVMSSVLYLVHGTDFRRVMFGLFLLFSFLFLTVSRIVTKLVLNRLRGRGFNFRNILIVGTCDRAREFARVVEDHVWWGLRVVGMVPAEQDGGHHPPCPYPVEGDINALPDLCLKHAVDEVVFCVPYDSRLVVEQSLQELEDVGVTVRMVLDVVDLRTTRRELSFFHDEIPILTFHSTAFDGMQLLYKRCLDIAGALLGLTLTLLLAPFIALAVKLDSPGPLLFGQQRVGEHGRLFTCWKFRTMYEDAEARKQELLARNEMSGAIFKIKDDPRITRVGRFLRATSLDELPQFWNVLCGEMSLVGTRPPTPDEVRQYENWHRRRISIRPGVTGLWQVSGRNRITDFDEIVRLDLRYIDNWTIWEDVRILLRTLWVVIARKGSS